MADDSLSTELLSGGIHFTGLGSGTDFDSMIEQLVAVEEIHTKRLMSWRDTWEEKNTAFQELNTSLLSLQTTMQSIDTPNEFLTKGVVSTDDSILTATADSSAEEGTHVIEVLQLAQNEIQISDAGISDQNNSINTSGSSGSFSYTYQGEDITIDVPSGTKLSALVVLINKDADNPGVRASIINDGTANGYHLQLRGMDQGSENTITNISHTNLDTMFDSFTQTQSAENAQVKVDGWDTVIERDSNSIDDIIQGINLSLKDTGTVNITSTIDTDAVKKNVQTFIDSVNSVISQITELTEVDYSGEGSLLTGNYGIQIIEQQIKSVLSSKGIGFDYDDDAITSLSSLGITTDANQGSPTIGQLLFDEEEFDKKLKNNPEAVAMIFSANDEPKVNSSDYRFASLVKKVTLAGEYDVEYTITGDPATDGLSAFSNMTINGQTARVSQNNEGDFIITSMAGNSRGLAIKVDNLNAGTYSGNVRIMQGKTGELADKLDVLADANEGPLHILQENYDDIMLQIDDKIAFEEKRISNYADHLKEKFANLEALLGTYESLKDSLSSQIDSLSS